MVYWHPRGFVSMAKFKNKMLQGRPWHFLFEHFNYHCWLSFHYSPVGVVIWWWQTHTAPPSWGRLTCVCLHVCLCNIPQQRAWHRRNIYKCLLREIKQPAFRQADLPICSAEPQQLGRAWREMNVWRSLPRGYYPGLVEDGLALFFFARRCAEVIEACQMCAARTKAMELSCLVLFSIWKWWCGHALVTDFTGR